MRQPPAWHAEPAPAPAPLVHQPRRTTSPSTRRSPSSRRPPPSAAPWSCSTADGTPRTYRRASSHRARRT
ncbi:hypothetical protein ACFYYS_38635 [Streptomyces sp. NPDC002120]|uniref:hypothetical protein n=1 Tax=Streptomyces sp. NPDC002120 TaxID=3364631 RepID=UPI003695D39C